MSNPKRIGVFGGTFDPIHIGHLAAVQDAASHLGLDRVLFVPNRTPPHKDPGAVSDVLDRIAMVELAIADNPLFQVSLVEIQREGPSYTLDTLRELRGQLRADAELFFLVGCDALAALHTWHKPEQLLEEFRMVVMDRPIRSEVDWPSVERHFPDIQRKVMVVHVAELEISGEDLRRRVREGRPIRYYVTPPVERYIADHRIYRRRTTSARQGSGTAVANEPEHAIEEPNGI